MAATLGMMNSMAAAPASLYVGDLDLDLNDAQLFDIFTDFSTLASVRVCRDSASGKSLGYGYVNFGSHQDAVRAIETKNHSMVNGKRIRVTWSHRDPIGRKNGVGNVFVKNLCESFDSSMLQEMFANFGIIISCKVATYEDGVSKGYGFVQFESEESADAAIDKLNGFIVQGKKLYVGKFVRRAERVAAGPEVRFTNLYIKNLDVDVNEEILHEAFSKFGKILSLVIAKDESGKSRGFGFVNFESPDNARHAMEAMNGCQLGSKNLYVARAQKKAEREHLLRHQHEERKKLQLKKYMGANVYIKNINDDVNDSDLRELFSQCGTITSAKLMRDERGANKGFGFVCFSTPDEATNAVKTFHGYMYHNKPLYVAIAQRKNERQAQLQVHYAQRMAGIPAPSTTFIASGYHPVYYTDPGVAVPGPSHQGLMYQQLGVRPGWRGNSLAASPRPAYQPATMPIIPNNTRPRRYNRSRVNNSLPPNGGPAVSGNQQRVGQARYVPNARREINSSYGVSVAASSSAGRALLDTQDLSGLLAASGPKEQKRILGEQLFPLVEEQRADLATKITGMLLEMDNSEILLLLDSPESLAAKVEEAVHVLKLSKAKLGKDGTHSTGEAAK